MEDYWTWLLMAHFFVEPCLIGRKITRSKFVQPKGLKISAIFCFDCLVHMPYSRISGNDHTKNSGFFRNFRSSSCCRTSIPSSVFDSYSILFWGWKSFQKINTLQIPPIWSTLISPAVQTVATKMITLASMQNEIRRKRKST